MLKFGTGFEILKKTKFMRYIFSFVAIIGLLSLHSCASQAESNQTLNLDLSGNWTLLHIHESSETTVDEGFPNKKPNLILEAISKKVTGNSGCNQLFGSFTTQQNRISFEGMGMTKMYCEGVKENEYVDLINKVKTYTIIDNQLILMDEEGTQLLKYSK